MPSPPPAFEDAVRAVVRSIPRGQVMSYGEVALEAGRPGAARAVGNLLARSVGLPWWRVVTAQGRLAPRKEEEHARRLALEGVEVTDGRVRHHSPAVRVTGPTRG